MKEKYFAWKASSLVLTTLLVLPILAIFYTAFGNSDEVFAHLLATVMPTYIFNTLVLTCSVLLLALLFGVPSAWLIAMCKLPGERWLQWALVLPLAMPAYIIGYLFTHWFDYAGPIQIALRDWTGWQAGSYWFPDIRSLGGASVVLALVLYPYVYLLCRAAFMEQNVTLLQSARLLKCSPWQSFRRISLPLARPAIAVGLSLVAMETIGDFGTVSLFAVNTLTTAVYDTWLGYSNLNAAAKISAIMLVMVLLLLSSERYSRRRQKLYQTQFNSHEEYRYTLKGWRLWAALIWCWGLVALVANFYARLQNNRTSVALMRLSSMGYAVPGTVLAIGILVPVLALDHLINDIAKMMEWGRPGLVFSGSLFAIVFALVVRFSAVAIGSIESSLSKVSPSLDMAARTMGCHANQMLKRVHLPLIRRGALIAGLLVFIESMKELNAAILLRPFNFETLATYVYNYASDERLELAALPAILLVLVGLIPLVMVNRSLEQKH